MEAKGTAALTTCIVITHRTLLDFLRALTITTVLLGVASCGGGDHGSESCHSCTYQYDSGGNQIGQTCVSVPCK
jgi:hypothetical protein